jgi:hypothetical protein
MTTLRRHSAAIHRPTDRRLRAMIETWEREGLISSEVAAQALAPQFDQAESILPTSVRRLRLGFPGYLLAVPGPAAALLVADAYVGPGSLLLIVLLITVALPQHVRSASYRPTAVTDLGPKSREVVINDRAAHLRRTSTLISTTPAEERP